MKQLKDVKGVVIMQLARARVYNNRDRAPGVLDSWSYLTLGWQGRSQQYCWVYLGRIVSWNILGIAMKQLKLELKGAYIMQRFNLHMNLNWKPYNKWAIESAKKRFLSFVIYCVRKSVRDSLWSRLKVFKEEIFLGKIKHIAEYFTNDGYCWMWWILIWWPMM